MKTTRQHILASLVVIGVAGPSLLVSASSCAAAQGLQRTAANLALPVEEEVKLGRQMAAEVERQVKLHPDRDVQAYVQRLGDRLASRARTRPPGIDFQFHVIDDDSTVNAFAIPGGHIYVYSGLMKLADDEAELASVISHEIAHVTERHIAERLVTQYGLQTVLALALGRDPSMLAQLAAQVAGTGALLKFSRDQESEADMRAIPTMVAAGYDPEGFVRLFTKMKRGENTPGFVRFLSDHPLPADRIQVAEERIARMRRPPVARNEDRYEAIERQL